MAPINARRAFGRTFVSVMLAQVAGPSWSSRRYFLALVVVLNVQSMRMCFAEFSASPHTHGVGGFIGLGSAAVREALGLEIAMLDHRERFAVGPKAFLIASDGKL